MIIHTQGDCSWYSLVDGEDRGHLWNKHLWCICPCQSQYTHSDRGWSTVSGWSRSPPAAKDNEENTTEMILAITIGQSIILLYRIIIFFTWWKPAQMIIIFLWFYMTACNIIIIFIVPSLLFFIVEPLLAKNYYGKMIGKLSLTIGIK